jgi:hypothetical protein
LYVVAESGHRLDSGNLFWRIHLDQDLLDTIIAIYPEWFKVRKSYDITDVDLCFVVAEGLREYKLCILGDLEEA